MYQLSMDYFVNHGYIFQLGDEGRFEIEDEDVEIESSWREVTIVGNYLPEKGDPVECELYIELEEEASCPDDFLTKEWSHWELIRME